MSPTAPLGLTAGQVCERLGLVPATLRAWNRRYGIGPTEHESGRYRYYDATDVAVLERMQSLIASGTPTAVAAELARRNLNGVLDAPPRTPRSLKSAVLKLDSATVDAALRHEVDSAGPLQLWNRLYRPVMRDIGERVAENFECLEAERLLSWSAVAALHRVAPPTTPDRARVILACCEGERHTVGLEVLRAALAEEDVPVVMLGENTPQMGLEAALSAMQGPVVVLAAQTARTAKPSRLKAVAGRSTVIAAGPGWTDVKLPDDQLWAPSVEACVRMVQTALR